MYILAVDADLPSLRLVEFLLRPLQAKVIYARSGQEALSLVQHQLFDLIILDLDLPDMGGIELARRVRDHPSLGKIPLLATVFGANDRVHEMVKAGFKAWVSKPIDTREFPKTVQSIIAQ